MLVSLCVCVVHVFMYVRVMCVYILNELAVDFC